MKILLINPSCVYDSGRDLYSANIVGPLFTLQFNSRMAMGIPLALPTLAACTPPEHEVRIVDEEIEDINFDEQVDLVGITAMTFKAKRAYELARKFRARGVKVVMGGIHASMSPDEVAEHVDSVVVGEAEDLWPKLLEDFSSGILMERYIATELPDLKPMRVPRYDLVKNRQYLYTYLQTTRGCPWDCKFCTVTKMNGRKLRKKTPEQVVAEVDALLKLTPKRQFNIIDRSSGQKSRFVGTLALSDDNFAIDRNHALSVCKALTLYQKEHGVIFSWFTQVNFETGFDKELLSAMREANCQHLIIGFESLDESSLKAMNKNMNSPERYAEAIHNIQAYDIRVIYSTIIGDDNAAPKNAEHLASFIEGNNVFHVLLNIMTPYPGTDLVKEIEHEGRMLDLDPQKYNIRNVVFQPHNMTPEGLQSLYYQLCERLFSFENVLGRGRKLLTNMHRLCLPPAERVAMMLGVSFTCLYLAVSGKMPLVRALQVIAATPLIVLNGSLLAVELLVMSADYDDFCRSERNRQKQSKSLS